jgi:hypothetical protein
VTSNWPDCELNDACQYYVRESGKNTFMDYAAGATILPAGNSRLHSYIAAQFSTDISGWTDVKIGAFKASCGDNSVASTCVFDRNELQAEWYVDAVHLEHTDVAITYHFTMRMAEFARAGDYIIVAYDQNHYAVSPEVIVLQDLGLYGISFGDRGDIAYCSANDGCSYYSNTDVVNTPYAFRLLEKQYATSYAGEAILATFSVADATGFDHRFEYRYVIVPGVCADPYQPDFWECDWNDNVQMDWTPDYLYYNADT